MRKHILGFALALITGTASAQSIGIKAGLNYATLKGDAAEAYDYRFGYVAGVTARHSFNNLVGLQTEALFSSKGGKREFTTNGAETEESLRLNYLDIPVLLSLQANGLYFELGPQVSFLLKGKQVVEVSKSNATVTTKVDVTDNPYPIDFGYAAGLGYRTNSGIGFGLRYNGGFKDIYDEGAFEGKEVKHASFQFTLSYTTGY